MKTFLPYPDFMQSAESLDDRRLGRQRSDVVAVLKKLTEPQTDDDHPAVKMWRGNERFLIRYGTAVCFEYQSRGNVDQTLEKILDFTSEFDPETDTEPEWWGNDNFHDSHKSYLARSLPSHYKPQWPEIPDELSLVWPRSPEKSRKDKEQRQKDALIRRAIRAKEKAEKYIEEARHAAEVAGLDPDTMEPLPEDEVEMVTIEAPDPDLLNL